MNRVTLMLNIPITNDRARVWRYFPSATQTQLAGRLARVLPRHAVTRAGGGGARSPLVAPCDG